MLIFNKDRFFHIFHCKRKIEGKIQDSHLVQLLLILRILALIICVFLSFKNASLPDPRSFLLFRQQKLCVVPSLNEPCLKKTSDFSYIFTAHIHCLAASSVQSVKGPSHVAAGNQRKLPDPATSGVQLMAEQMVAAAAAVGEQLQYHAVTPGDGNCFYHALLDQVRNRPEVRRLVERNVAESDLADHLHLRRAVVGYARANVPYALIGFTEAGFHKFLDAQAKSSAFAENSVIQLAAQFLGVDIWLTSDRNSPAAPYTRVDSGEVPSEAHIILGYIEQTHFQSLYPVTEAEVSLATDGPPAKKSRLSDAERKMLVRATETEDSRQARLAQNALRMAEIRRAELPAEREQRLAADALQKSHVRQAESQAEREQRLAANALQMSQARQAESQAEREQRLAANALQMSQARHAESQAEREQRLAANALQMSQARHAESQAEREQRLAADALQKSQARQAESSLEREQRLAAHAQHMSQTRQAETAAERDERLAAAAQAMSQLRESRRSQASASSDAVEPAEAAESSRPGFWEQGLEFHRAMGSRDFRSCGTCGELHFTEVDSDGGRYVCKRCTKDPVTFSAENDMDPGPVPNELAGLTQIEQLLIAQIIPMMTIVRLPRGGQFGYRGNVINLPQDLPSLVTCLPRRVTDTDIVIVRKQGENNTHRDFRVRRNVVHDALVWLQQHNPYYSSINISEDNLHLLPEDDIVDVQSIEQTDVDECPVAENLSSPTDDASCDDDVPAEMASTFIPLNIPQPTETAAVQASLHLASPIQWPAVSDRPVNEFETVGYVTRCFPALLPTGGAELRSIRPRDKRVHEPAYFEHLIRYQDQRFAQHPRFIYFAYNTLLRHRALATGRMYLHQHPEENALTREDALQLPEAERHQLAKKIVRFGGHLRGSRQYWFSQRMNLMALIDQLGTPHCYFTLSSADMQWPDLQGYLRRFGGVQSPSAAVACNPLLCTWYMHERVTLFLQTFLCDVLGLHTYWARHEYQHRGSLHTHGVGYLREGMDVTEVARLADTFPDRLAEYVDRLVTAWHPAPPVAGRPFVPPVPHPCAKRFEDVDDCECDYESLVNCVQRHTRCAAGYCLRKKRGSAVAECRFGYPKPLTDSTTVSVERSDNGQVELTVEPKRNDPLLNCHNRAIVQTWRANVDFQLIHDRRKVVEYLAKYISKSEPVSQNLADLFDTALRTTDATSERAVTTAIQRLLIKVVCERDISAQEVCHHLLELPMVLCSRQFHVLAVDGLHVERELVSDSAPGRRVSKCDLDKYVARDPERESLSMVEYFKKFYRSRNQRRGEYDAVRRKELIVRVVPRLCPCPSDPEKHARFCQQQLMLHKPFRRVSQLTDGYADAVEAYNAMVHSQESFENGGNIEAEVANYQHDAEYDPVSPTTVLTTSCDRATNGSCCVRLSLHYTVGTATTDRCTKSTWSTIGRRQQCTMTGPRPTLLLTISDSRQWLSVMAHMLRQTLWSATSVLPLI